MISGLAREQVPLRFRALLALLFGLTALSWLDLTFGQFVLVFGAYLLLDGIGAIVCGVLSEARPTRWAFLAEGAACCTVGIVAFVHPFVSMGLLVLVASWGILTGVLELVVATRLPSQTSQWLLGLAGISSIFLGMLLLAVPGAGSAAVVRVIGVYAVGFSVLLFLASIGMASTGFPASPRRLAAQ